ncbi:MAG: IS21 family transposase, partial [Saprospiraceae bacterium]|nr:IS21 family transposase [Saprospiraceae bacterium]
MKATARQLKVSRNTVREYVRRAEAYSADLSLFLELEEEALSRIFSAPDGTEAGKRLTVFEEKVDYWLKELPRVGVTRELLWQEYRSAHQDGYGYSQFCEHLRRQVGRRDLTLALDHEPGEVLMVDFAGKKMEWVDVHSGEVVRCEVLVAVLPFSQYSFCIALPSQRLPDFIHGLNEALLFLGGLPKVILSDNLKAYVSKPDRYEPTFTQLCEQLGAHYQLDLQAARVATPKDKASVENAVTQVYRRIYAPLRQEVYHSPEALNEAMRGQLIQHNTQPYQKKSGTRQSLYEQYELPQMRALPADLFEIKKIARAKVQRNYHVFLGEEKNFYSVPWQYAGKQAEICYTNHIVEVYVAQKRIATHQRLFLRGREYRYQTREEHMPRHHQEWKKAQGYDAAYFLQQGQIIGPHTQWAMQQVLLGRIHEVQAYNSCKGILQLAKKYTPERLEQAAKRCGADEKATYNMLK